MRRHDPGPRAPRHDHAPRQTLRALLALAALGAATAARTRDAHADPLVVDTVEFGSWPDAMAHIESAAQALPFVVHVRVRDPDGHAVACGSYSLSLDATGASAFDVRTCDPATNTTALALTNRTALFDPLTNRPNAVEIRATQVRTAQAVGGGRAGSQGGGSQDGCGVLVQPYVIRDNDHARVYLEPGRFELRPASAVVQAAVVGNMWILSAAGAATRPLAYDVWDRQRREVAYHGSTSMGCTALGGGTDAPTGVTMVSATVYDWINANEEVHGTLSDNDPEWERGRRYHEYRFLAYAGDHVVINLHGGELPGQPRSHVDAYLGLFLGDRMITSDDDSGGGLDSRIDRVMSETGTYSIRATTGARTVGGTGYTVQLQVQRP
jgi:hypothetical protein